MQCSEEALDRRVWKLQNLNKGRKLAGIHWLIVLFWNPPELGEEDSSENKVEESRIPENAVKATILPSTIIPLYSSLISC